MRSAKEYRKSAREKLIGNYGVIIGAYIVFTIILNILTTPLSLVSGVASGLTGFGVLGGIISVPLSFIVSIVSELFANGVNKIVYDVSKGEKADFGNLFYCFTHNPLTVIFACLWMLLYMLPPIILMAAALIAFGLVNFLIGTTQALIASTVMMIIVLIIYCIWMYIIALSVSMTFFIYYENPEMKARELVSTSRSMMKGHKAQLFGLYFSYIGYYILCLLSCGLALLWINPNVTAATVLFYEDLKSTGSSEQPERAAANPVEESGNTYYQQEYWN